MKNYKGWPLALTFAASLLMVHCNGRHHPGAQANNAQASAVEGQPGEYLANDALTGYVQQASTINPVADAGLPFTALQYDKVIAYDFYGWNDRYPSILDSANQFVPVVLKQQQLNQQQAMKILQTLSSSSTYGNGISACFKPHLAFVLFNGNTPVQKVDVCLSCNYLISSVPIPAQQRFANKKTASGQTGMIGFSDKGREAMMAFCSEVAFHNKIAPTSTTH